MCPLSENRKRAFYVLSEGFSENYLIPWFLRSLNDRLRGVGRSPTTN